MCEINDSEILAVLDHFLSVWWFAEDFFVLFTDSKFAIDVDVYNTELNLAACKTWIDDIILK
jgi:hypothetical protein